MSLTKFILQHTPGEEKLKMRQDEVMGGPKTLQYLNLWEIVSPTGMSTSPSIFVGKRKKCMGSSRIKQECSQRHLSKKIKPSLFPS